ncbi:MAG TPA: hypothetical protein VH025_08425 [Solirubrobacteraceae bacterium]|jgi:hypothetical protein|nr:hypothetical protein [Solirubrobacteraceae bacterium]
MLTAMARSLHRDEIEREAPSVAVDVESALRRGLARFRFGPLGVPDAIEREGAQALPELEQAEAALLIRRRGEDSAASEETLRAFLAAALERMAITRTQATMVTPTTEPWAYLRGDAMRLYIELRRYRQRTVQVCLGGGDGAGPGCGLVYRSRFSRRCPACGRERSS